MLAMVTATAVAVYGHIRFRTVGDLVIIVGAAVTFDALLRLRRSGPASPPPQPQPEPNAEPTTEPIAASTSTS
jgi:hypothetical protein